MSPEDAEELRLLDGDPVRITSRRGSVVAPVRIDRSLRTGLVLHDAPLPGRGEDQPPHHRLDRPQVRAPPSSRPAPSGSSRCGPARIARPSGDLPRPDSRSDNPWISISCRPTRPPRSARRSTRSSVRPPPGGMAASARARDAHTSAGGHAARGQRHLLLPALQAVQSRSRLDQRRRAQLHLRAPVGSAGRRLRRRHLLRAALHRAAAPAGACTSAMTSPAAARAPPSCARSWSGRSARPITTDRMAISHVIPDDGAVWLRSPCLGLCDQAPAALLTIAGEKPVERLFGGCDAESVAKVLSGDLSPTTNPHPRLPQAGEATLRLLRRVDVDRSHEPRRVSCARRLSGAAPRH